MSVDCTVKLKISELTTVTNPLATDTYIPIILGNGLGEYVNRKIPISSLLSLPDGTDTHDILVWDADTNSYTIENYYEKLSKLVVNCYGGFLRSSDGSFIVVE